MGELEHAPAVWVDRCFTAGGLHVQGSDNAAIRLFYLNSAAETCVDVLQGPLVRDRESVRRARRQIARNAGLPAQAEQLRCRRTFIEGPGVGMGTRQPSVADSRGRSFGLLGCTLSLQSRADLDRRFGTGTKK